MGKQELTRRELLQAGLGVLASATLPSSVTAAVPFQPQTGSEAGAASTLPNVVYIFADQLRACSVGCYGNDEVDTPRIDAFATEGARFANSVSTSPLCTPHRACLMTGRYPHVTGVTLNDIKLPPAETCIAEVFQDNGYRTGYVGKWHLDGPTENMVEDPGWVSLRDRQGFRHWMGFNLAHVYYDSKYYRGKDPTIQQIPPGLYEPDFQTDEAIRFITANRKRAFCLFLSLGPPHQQTLGKDLPPGGDYTFPYNPASLTLRPNVDHPDPDYVRQEYADYYGMVSNFDWNVGRILDTLETLRLTNRTIVVVSSDHGDLLGSHFTTAAKYRLRAKTRIQAESLDVPFALRFPSKIGPQVVNDVFTSVDIMPTLLGLCRLPIPDGVMGRDFSPLLTRGRPPADPPWGPVPSTESALIGMFERPWVGVRTPEYSLECLKASFEPTSLYQNTVDPFQLTNVVDDPAYQEIKDALYQEFLAWAAYVGLEPG